MDSYTGFSYLYDMFMDNIPYESWYAYIKELLLKHNINNGIILDLGCGTGTITQMLAEDGYDMIGIDNSEEMLQVAMEKNDKNHLNILYLLQDMREFELYGTVAAIVSICDSMNYITEYEDLVQVFRLANNYLDPEGLFIFDMTTDAKYSSIGNSVITDNRDEGSFIWENNYFPDKKINQYDLTIFARVDENGNLYERFDETHIQRVYEIDEVKRAISDAGMEFVAVYDAFTFDTPTPDSERIYFIAKEKFSEKKTYTVN